ncbi:MauE/DoxX family redox-associated membrane protein [Paenibacillus sp. S-12]|uniref:MauE/DoxX family redox-associated membrane protein n=1 Tax=Paenibacillus sp. S-12 TaxID=3031371 RepID=UPI0025A30756|nr:MauE/DoxX family redox-associated membrane protein [Paenibacillus sp. S-12]
MSELFIVKVLLGTIFLFSGAIKLMNIKSFEKTLKSLDLGKRITKFVAFFIPLFELATFMVLFIPGYTIMGSIFIYVLLICFSYAIWKAKYKKIKCNCFGSLTDEELGFNTIIKLSVLFIMNCILMAGNILGKSIPAIVSVQEYVFAFIFSFLVIVLYSLCSLIILYKKSAV